MFVFGTSENAGDGGWVLTLYSLITIFLCSRVVARVIDGASYDKLLFIIFDQNMEQMRDYIMDDLQRSATYIKAQGMYTHKDKEMIFLVVNRKEVKSVQKMIHKIDEKAFVVVTDAYDTYGEGFKPFPKEDMIEAE